MRIGIYSGTFDPIHEGHVLFAEVACEQFGLDKVLLIPEAVPRYKSNASALKDRLAMAKLATENAENNLEVVSYEDLLSHTVNGVIKKVYADYPEDEYFLVMGADVFNGVGKWGLRDDEDGHITDISKAVAFIVGVDSTQQLPELKKIAQDLSLNVRFIEIPVAGISSGSIREAIKNSKTPSGLNDKVSEFIKYRKLYSSAR